MTLKCQHSEWQNQEGLSLNQGTKRMVIDGRKARKRSTEMNTERRKRGRSHHQSQEMMRKQKQMKTRKRNMRPVKNMPLKKKKKVKRGRKWKKSL